MLGTTPSPGAIARPGIDEHSQELDDLIARTAAIYASGINDATRKTYARRWRMFEAWCHARHLTALPAAPETVMLYLADSADGTGGAALSTLRGWLAAINRVHVEAGVAPPGDDPAMGMFLKTLSRVAASDTRSTPVSALRVADLRVVCHRLDDWTVDPIEVRDRALLCLHRAGLGDGDMARLRWSDISLTLKRARLLVRSPRADRSDHIVNLRAASKDPAACSVTALRAWREVAHEDVPWVFTYTDQYGARRDRPWDSRAIRRIRLARIKALSETTGPDSRPLAAIRLLGQRPSLILRDKALLLVGFAGAFRRPDLIGLTWDDIAFDDQGITLRLRRSKTDTQGRGTRVGIPRGTSALTCPVRAMEAWRDRCEQQLGAADLVGQPCFPIVGRSGRIGRAPMTPEAITRIVRRRTEDVGIAGRWGGRSLRAGFISSAADLDIPLELIARQSRHATLDSLILYIRSDDPFRRNPAGQLGL